MAKNRHPAAEYAEPDPAARIASYVRVLEDRLRALNALRLRLRVPELRGMNRPGQRPFHATPEMFLQLVGATGFDCPDEAFVLRAGEVCVMPRGMPHGEVTCNAPGRYLTLIMMFWPDGFSLHYGHTTKQHTVLSDTHDRFRSNFSMLPRYLDEVANAFHAGNGTDRHYVRGLMTAVLAEMIRAIKSPRVPAPQRSALTRRCLDLIQVHLDSTELAVKMLAARLGCTADHLSRVFVHETGFRLTPTINQARIERSLHLLRNPRLSIGEVSWMSGFATQSYYSKVFQGQVGMTPGEYRAGAAEQEAFVPVGILERLSWTSGAPQG